MSAAAPGATARARADVPAASSCLRRQEPERTGGGCHLVGLGRRLVPPCQQHQLGPREAPEVAQGGLGIERDPAPERHTGRDAIDRRDVGRERPPTGHDDRALGSVEHQRGELVAKVVTIGLRRTGTGLRLPQTHHLGSGSTGLRPVSLGEHRHHIAARIVDEAVDVQSVDASDRVEDPLGRVSGPADDEHGLAQTAQDALGDLGPLQLGGPGRQAGRPRRPVHPGQSLRDRGAGLGGHHRAIAGDAARRPARRGSRPAGAGGRRAVRRRPGASAGCGRGASAATAASARFPTPTRSRGRCAPRRARRRSLRPPPSAAGCGCRARVRRRVSSRPW